MHSPSITVALLASIAAAFFVAGMTMPPPVLGVATASPSEELRLAQAEGGRSYRDGDRMREPRRTERGRQRDRSEIVDCHRDVRTHRINGRMVTHRHVGDDCRIRVVNQSSVPPAND